jgi:hypothetical protein
MALTKELLLTLGPGHKMAGEAKAKLQRVQSVPARGV